MKIVAVIGIILIMNSPGEYETDISIWLMLLQAIVGFILITPAYVNILKEEANNEEIY